MLRRKEGLEMPHKVTTFPPQRERTLLPGLGEMSEDSVPEYSG